jgi:hypothetical protein
MSVFPRRKPFPSVVVSAIAIAALFTTSCWRDEGFIAPGDDRNLPALGYFQGKAFDLGDSIMPRDRLLNLVHPRIAVLWRSVGLRDWVAETGEGNIESFTPFPFSLSLLQPPPKEVLDAPEIAFGFFSLFSDVNRNGRFDRPMDPKLNGLYVVIDSLIKAHADAQAALAQVSELRARTLVSERYYLDAPGVLIRVDGDARDTVWRGSKSDTVHWTSYLDYRQRVMGNQNRWEKFFAKRKKENDFYFRTFPALGHISGIELRYERAFFPKPGKEDEFTAASDRAVGLNSDLTETSNFVIAKAFLGGMLEYPFTGFDQAGEDWMAGRSITDLLVFFRDQASLDTMLRAVPVGTFQVDHLERLHPGYNLLHCDDQYNCDALGPNDSISIFLGASEKFFNQPPTKSKKPFPSISPAGAADDTLGRFQGRYALNGGDTLSFLVSHGETWLDYPGTGGLLRVLPQDSIGFAAPFTDLQGVFTSFPEGAAVRLVLYYNGKRSSLLSVGQPVDAVVKARVEAASGFVRAPLSDSLIGRYVGKYDFKGDTLRVEAAGGDSLRVSVPGFAPSVYHAANDSLFRCPWGEWSLEFQGAARNGGVRKVVFRNGLQKKVVPVFNPAPSNLLKTAPGEATGIDWIAENQGSGRDTYTGFDGRKRYSACSQDGNFLRAGDGYLSDLFRSGATDSISLKQGGDFAVFRLPGLKGKTAALQLRQCADRIAKNKRTRVSVWVGADPDPSSAHQLYGDDQWLYSDTAGVYWMLDSLAVDSDPYYLMLKEEDTPDAPFANAFDGYRLGVRP